MKTHKPQSSARRRKVCAAVATLAAATVWAASSEITVEKGSPVEVTGGGVSLLEADTP